MSEKFKPCPFCGKDEANFTTDKWGNYHVECEYCGAQTNPYHDKELVIEEWQTRPIEDDLRKRIAELEAEIDQLTAHDATERKDDKSPNDTQTQTIVYGKESEE